MREIKGCTALITGASSGFGVEFALQLAGLASCLILTARRVERLEELKARIERPGLRVYCFEADLSREGSVEELLVKMEDAGLRVDFLVNNAGLGDHGGFKSSEWERVEEMIAVNIRALTRLTSVLLPPMVAAGKGAILNVSSIASLLPVPKMAVYAASKAYVTSFSEGLRAELRGTGVSVTALCPGPVDTEFFTLAERAQSKKPMYTPGFFKVSPGQVVRAGLRAVAQDRARVIPGLLVASVMTLSALVPMFVFRALFWLGRGRK